MDYSRLSRSEYVGIAAGLILVLALFLPWYSLGAGPDVARGDDPAAWACGIGENSCSAFETFPVLRWLLLVAALSPVVLALVVLADWETSWPRGELTAIIGMIAFVLIFFNGLIDRPSERDIQVHLDWGYFIALLSAAVIFGAGAVRSLDSGGGAPRRPPGSFG